MFTNESSISRIYERCGIMTACLTDPLSQLINKITGSRDDDPNSVGFYYEAELHGVNKCTVILFNIYDNDAVPWLRLGYTMDLLLASPFVNKITYYPLAKTSASPDSTNHRVNKRLEDMFRAVVVETIGANAAAIHDKNISYTILLLKIIGIEDSRLTSNLITGYSLVNRVLLTLMGIKQSDLTKISSSIIPCPLLEKPISVVSRRENINEIDIKYIVEESRREITKLVAIFVDLFTTHETFRTNILSLRSGNNISKTSSVNLDGLFSKENELVSHIVGGIQNGIISNGTLNEIISDLDHERFVLVEQVPTGIFSENHQPLPLSTSPAKNIHISDNNIPCTFKCENTRPASFKNIDSLRDLGTYINHVATSLTGSDSFDKSTRDRSIGYNEGISDNYDSVTINLGGMVAAYNESIQGTNLPAIIIPNMCHPGTISRQAIITIPGNSDVFVPPNPQIISIPMYNGNLSRLSKDQLLDILVYIDSLRDNVGTVNTRFSNLQNEITHELAQRREVR